MRILLLALLLFGPFLDAMRGPFRNRPKRVQNNVLRLRIVRKILSNIEARETRRDNQTHLELQTIKDRMVDMMGTLQEIKNATKDLSKATDIPESHRIEKPQSETWVDYSLGTFIQPVA